MASKIVVREVSLAINNNAPHEILAGDNFLVIGVTYTSVSNQHLTAVTVDGLDAVLVAQASGSVNGAKAQLWRYNQPTVGAAIVIGGSGPVSDLSWFVAKCNLAYTPSPVRASGGHGENTDQISETVASEVTDKVFYCARRNGGAPVFYDVTTQTAEQRDSRLAYEDGSSPSSQASFGAAPDTIHVIVAASIRGPTRAGGPQGWFG